MATSVGERIAHYEIMEVIGAGGMGVVYRAHDERLERDVAIKALTEDVARDSQRIQRLEREAKLLAAINHPNIGAIYGLERRGDQRYLILELVEGETLQEMLRRGPVPVPRALEMAKQIAEALEAAHERGVVHRDLKPENVKLTRKGHVKVLDFGLAKVSAVVGGDEPTLAVGATEAGMILGTPGYMSPEQARGLPVDRKADIWAFGCILFYLLSGEPPFGGETLTDRLTAILHREPDLEELPPATPPRVRWLLKRCLEKDLRRRLNHIGDARLLIEDAVEVYPAAPAPARSVWWMSAIIAGLAFLLGVGGMHLARRGGAEEPEPRTVRRLQLQLGGQERLQPDRPFVLSPDGGLLAYVASNGGEPTLRLRDLRQGSIRELPGTEGANNPFFSPDGRWVGFVAGDAIKKVDVDGGTLVAVAQLPGRRRQTVGASASWGPDDTIVFGLEFSSGLYRVAAGGGRAPVPLTELAAGEIAHYRPQFLPGGRRLLFTVRAGIGVSDASWIELFDLATGERRKILDRGDWAIYSASGHLLYSDGGTVFATPFDASSGKVTGSTPAVVLEASSFVGYGGARLTVASDGTAVYDPSPLLGVQPGRLVWVDREGNIEPIEAPRKSYSLLKLSPDGSRLGATVDTRSFRGGVALDIWLLDLVRGGIQPFTSGGGNNHYFIWTPDAQRVVFTSDRDGYANLYWQPAAAGAAPEKLLGGPLHQDPGSFSPDGRWLAYAQDDPDTHWDLWVADLRDKPTARPFLATRFEEIQPMFSPDGKWIAFSSNESGRWEVYVRPFEGEGQWKISAEGGEEPLWSPLGDELFYREGNTVMAVPIQSAGGFSPSRPKRLFSGEFRLRDGFGWPSYDIARDGRRFVMIEQEELPRATHLEVILDWFAELEELAPTGGGAE